MKKVVEEREIFLTPKQHEWFLLMPNSADVAAGRGSGKTTHIATPWVLEKVVSMPRALGAIQGKTYSQLLTNIIPKFLKSLGEYGLNEDEDYWVGKRPPATVPTAFYLPRNLKHCICFKNGHCIVLLSQDRKSPANGLDIQWLWVDEFRLINYDQLGAETIPMLRGCLYEYGKQPGYLGVLTTSDKPRKSEAPWFYERRKIHTDQHRDTILMLQKLILDTEKELGLFPTKAKFKRLTKELQVFKDELNRVRKMAKLYFEMTTLDNVAGIGPDAILKLKLEQSDEDFRRTVLNEDDGSTDDSYYTSFNFIKHLYPGDNDGYVHSLGIGRHERDCRWDDLYPDKPLIVSMDYNAAITSMVVAQQVGKELRIVNCFWVTGGETLFDCVDVFAKYYEFHPLKRVRFIYDNTAVGKDASGRASYADSVASRLRHHKWQVTADYMRQATKHHERYLIMMKLMMEEDSRQLYVRFSESTTQQLITSMMNTKKIQKGSFINKDKSGERKKHVAPEDAPHLSEAFDCLVTGLLREQSYQATVRVPLMTS